MRGLRRRPGARPAATPVAETDAAPAPGRFADQLLVCEICGRTFVFTVEEQRRLADAGLPVEPPTQCFRHTQTADNRPTTEARPTTIDEGQKTKDASPVIDQQPLTPNQPAIASAPSSSVARPSSAGHRPSSSTSRPSSPAPRPSSRHEEFGVQYTVRSLGHVKWFDPAKGYGFIEDDDDGQEYFVHQSALEGGIKVLHEGQLVEFETAHKARGVEAVLVIVLE